MPVAAEPRPAREGPSVNATGWALSAGSVVLTVAGYGLGYREVLAVGLAGLVLVVAAAGLVALRPFPQVERRVDPERVQVGDVAEGLLTVTNEGRRTIAAATAVERVGSVPVSLAVPRLRPGQAVTVPYRLPTDRRAVVPVGPLTVRAADPFGLLARQRHHGSSTRLVVHPRTFSLQPLPEALRRDQEGITDASRHGDRVFHSLREYVIGDDLRRVHWKATAHRGELMVREHVDPARPDVTVVLDDRAEVLGAGMFELAVEIVASVVLASAGRAFPVRLRTVSATMVLDPAAGRFPLLDALAAVERHSDVPAAGVARALADVRPGRALVVVTGGPDAALRHGVAQVARRADAVVVVALGPGTPPAVPGATVLAADGRAAFVSAWNGRR